MTWVPDLPFYFEGLVGVFNGDNEAAFGRGRLRDPLVTARLRTFFELGDTGGLQIGASLATGCHARRAAPVHRGLRRQVQVPPGGLAASPADGGRRRDVVAADEQAVRRDDRRRGEVDPRRAQVALDRFGWYTYVEVQPFRRWAGGVRYDNTELLQDPGREWAVEPYLTFMPSEFLRFRLAYKHTNRSDSHPLAVALGRRSFDEILLQASFILGAHPAHPF